IGGVIGFFKAKKLQNDMKNFCTQMGMEVSEAYAKEIRQFAKENDISKEFAVALKWNEAISDAGGMTAKTMQQVAKNTSYLFAEINKGGKLAGEAVEDLNDLFGQMRDVMDNE